MTRALTLRLSSRSPPPVSITHTLCPTRLRSLRPTLRRKLTIRAENADPKPDPTPDDADHDGLLPEEDWTVPGGANDSLSSNTPLGRAVRSASEELEHLSKLEKEVLDQAYELLDRLISKPHDDSARGRDAS